MALLKLASVFNVENFWLSTDATISLVVVLPAEPVICTMGMGNSPRYQEASAFSAKRVSSTRM